MTAEAWQARAEGDLDAASRTSNTDLQAQFLARAQVHATLALAATIRECQGAA